MLRNLSWRADVNSKKTLREVGSVRALMECALEVQKVRTFFCCVLKKKKKFFLYHYIIFFFF